MDGARPPVLFVHGMWHAAWAWENWMSYFAQHGYSCHAVDLRGHGDSEGDWRTARLADHLDDVRRAIAALAEPPVLVGHSLGGRLVLQLLAEATHPAAILVASVPGRYPLRVAAREAARAPVVTAASLLRGDLRPYVQTPSRVRRALFTGDTSPAVVRETHARLTGASPRLVRQMLMSRPPPPVPGTPTLVIAGGRDPLFGGRVQVRLAKRLDATYAQVDNSGHDIALDGPWRHGARAAVGWLDERRLV